MSPLRKLVLAIRPSSAGLMSISPASVFSAIQPIQGRIETDLPGERGRPPQQSVESGVQGDVPD